MGVIITFLGQKGGPGKSTLAVGTAAEFTRRGYKTLLVDCDDQGTSLTWGDVASEAEGFEPPIVMGMQDNIVKQLRQAADPYDVCVVDTPGVLGKRLKGALIHTDLAIVPLPPNTADAWALGDTLEVIRVNQEQRMAYASDFPLVAAILLNKLRNSTSAARTAQTELVQVLDRLGYSDSVSVMATQIHLRNAFDHFLGMGIGVHEYAKIDRNGRKAADEIAALVDELEAGLGLDFGSSSHERVA